MRRTTRQTVLALMCLCVAALQAEAQRPSQPPPEIGIMEKLGDTMPLQLEVYDEKGYPVALKDIVKHPTVLTFVYFRCPSICSPLLTEVARIVDKTDLEIGKDYQIVTLSFDHREKPELAA